MCYQGAEMKDLAVSALLRSELNRRMTDNQSYSLRAFARSLKIDPSTLSKIINGRRKLGNKAQLNLLAKLGFNKDESFDAFSQITDENFEQIPEWYDTAILEQITVAGFRASSKSLAQVLSLNEVQITSALLRLKKLNLIKISKKGYVTDATSGQTSNVTPSSTNLTKKNLQKRFLEKAIHSIDNDPLGDRDMTTITCAIDPQKIGEAKVRIKAFRREMAEFFASGRKSNRVYNITVALYPISKNYKEFL